MTNSQEGKKQSWDGMFYSIQRIDLLIISICGAGIYVCLETIKYLASTKTICECLYLIKFSAFFFLIGIILNLISQQFGYKANQQSYLMYDCEIEIEETKTQSNRDELMAKLECDKNNYDKESERFSNLTTTLNYTSMVFMFLGLIFTFIFFIVTF
ncbi:hypothetical protein [Flavobacterium ustbae]|uniref:hypothetical protein n=1 Tax=Flavobacterium ustbae TaxID=2488790 RepID=UPI000F7A29A1|nr:hypothetical protein [Flavobacterium ustbae]